MNYLTQKKKVIVKKKTKHLGTIRNTNIAASLFT